MKQRTTFLLDSLEAIDTDNAVFAEDIVSLPGSLFLARQDRLIVSSEELPSEMEELFKQLYMFRIQWSCVGSKHLPAFQNFGLDGFSVHLIPTTLEYEPVLSDEFGAFLDKCFGIGFNNTNLISTATSASWHKVTQVKSSTFQSFLNKIAERLDRISFVQAFDIRWEKQSLIIEWVSDPYEANIRKSPSIRKEIALFEAQQLSSEDLELSGIRTVLSADEYTPPTKTLIIAKARHNVLNATVAFEFEQPLGLHPTIQLKQLDDITPPHPQCELFVMPTLPNTLFFDQYQYDEKHLSLITSWGEDDLEAPEWKVSRFGSQQLFHVPDRSANLELTFHSRYIVPSVENTFEMVTPEVFWACDSLEFMEPEDSAKLEGNPFESYNLGYESFFEPSTVFYHLNKNLPILTYTIPAADKSDYNVVQYGTSAIVIIGTLYLIKKFYEAFSTMQPDTDKKADSKKEK